MTDMPGKDFTPDEARTYIDSFRETTGLDATYVQFEAGDMIYLNNMTDDEAIRVARGLWDIEQAGTANVPRH